VLVISYKQKARPGTPEHIKEVTSAVDDKALLNTDNDPDNWLSYRKNYSEDHYTSLDQVNKEKVNQLGLVDNLGI